MSIENLLTLGLAAGLLAAAAALRLLFLGALKLFYLVSGRQVTQPQADAETLARTPRQRRPLARPALDRLASLGRGVVLVLATVGTWMAAATSAIAKAATAGYASMSPRVAAGTKTGLRVGAGKIKSFAIVAAATLQYLARTVIRLVSEQVAMRSARRRERPAAAEEVQQARVIRLDRDWDPLTDPLEDMPASNYR